jgi:hypothetical protein
VRPAVPEPPALQLAPEALRAWAHDDAGGLVGDRQLGIDGGDLGGEVGHHGSINLRCCRRLAAWRCRRSTRTYAAFSIASLSKAELSISAASPVIS